MAILKTDMFKVEAIDYIITEISIILDLDFKSESSVTEFLDIYKNNCSSALNFEIEGLQRSGYLGTFVYDVNYKARLYITDRPCNTKHRIDALRYNLYPVINDLENRISMLIKMLSEKGILSSEALGDFNSYLPKVNGVIDLEYQVKDLSQLLIDTGFTLEELRHAIK